MTELQERELHDLLERAAAIDGQVDVHGHWEAGRRRRRRRGAGAGLAGVAALLAAAGALAQTGVLGGSGAVPTGPAAVPDDLETFVLAAPDATGTPDGPGLRVPAAGDLSGSTWTLRDDLWQDAGSASALTGTDETTVVTFGDASLGGGWGLTIGGCGTAAMPGPVLDERGRFAATVPTSGDLGCAQDVQDAEDFWVRALSGGGQLTLGGDGWLLLSVAAPAPPGPTPTDEARPTGTPTGVGEGDDGAAAPRPTTGTAAPTVAGGPTGTAATSAGRTEAPGSVPPSPTGAPTVPPAPGAPTAAPGTPTASAPPTPTTSTPSATAAPTRGTPTPTTAAPGPTAPTSAPPTAPEPQPFLAASAVSTDEPWPAGGGELFAPTVRAGTHEGFDRVVVDLTGIGDPGWRAAWTTDPVLDGSGAPSDVAGDSVLEVRLTGMAYPPPGSDVYAQGVYGLDTHTLGRVVEVQRTTPFEGMLQVFVGVSGDPLPYRVFVLEDPLRLVVDVRTGP